MSKTIARVVVVGLSLLGLAACVSPEELRQQDVAACTSYGFKQGTTDFAACLQRESLARRYEFYSMPPPGPYGYAYPWW